VARLIGDREVYTWIGNRLSTIHELDDEYFVEIFKVIEQERKRREAT
jgi:hypothetical protein